METDTPPHLPPCSTLFGCKTRTSIMVASAGSHPSLPEQAPQFSYLQSGSLSRLHQVTGYAWWVWMGNSQHEALQCLWLFLQIVGALGPPPVQPLLRLRPSWRDGGARTVRDSHVTILEGCQKQTKMPGREDCTLRNIYTPPCLLFLSPLAASPRGLPAAQNC